MAPLGNNASFPDEVHQSEPPWSHIVGNRKVEDAHWKQYNMKVMRPDDPIPARHTFRDSAERTVSLVFGAADELHREKVKSEAYAEVVQKMLVFPILGSAWLANEGDEEKFGVKPTGQPTMFVAVVKPTDITRTITPEVGDYVTISFSTKQGHHTPPKHNVSYIELNRTATELANSIDLARAKGSLARHHREQQLNVGEAAIEDAYWNAYRRFLVPTLLGYVPPPTGDQIKEYRKLQEVEGNPEVTHTVLRQSRAVEFAETLHPTPSEGMIAHKERIFAWLIEHPGGYQSPVTEDGLKCRARRIGPPPGITADVVYYRFESPRQPNWPHLYEAPPVIDNLKLTDFDPDIPPHDIGQTLEEMFSVAEDSPNQVVFETGFITPTVREKSTNVECRSVYEWNHSIEGSPERAFWEHTLNFSGVTDKYMVNLLEPFPSLRQNYHAGVYTGQTLDAMEALKSTICGKVFISGCAGSGKSTLAMLIATEVTKAVCDSNIPESNPEALPGYPPETTEKALDKHVDKGKQRTEEIGQEKHRVRLPASVPIVQATQEEQLEERWAKLMAAQENRKLALEAKRFNHFNRDGGIRPGRVTWVTVTNSQADDAVERFKHVPDLKVVRLYNYNAEMANLLRKAPKEFQDIPFPKNETSTVLSILNRHVRAGLMDEFQSRNPGMDADSLSNLAKRIAAEDPKWCTIRHAQAAQEEDPVTWETNKAVYEKCARDLLEATLGSVHVVCTTPVVAHDLPKHSKWVPDLVVLDDAGRMTEAMTFAAIAKHRSIPTLFVGDSKQLGPVSQTMYESTRGDGLGFQYKTMFGPQRLLSLLHRADTAGCLDIILTENRRAVGDVANYAAANLYNGSMEIIHEKPNHITDKALDYLRSIHPKTATQSLFVDLVDGEEERIGTSYINKTSARFVAETAVQTYRDSGLGQVRDASQCAKVLIMTGYGMQRSLIQSHLDALSATEVPPGAISVRTINESSSHQAEIVIIDLIHTSDIGFMSEAGRMAVMTTRANYINIYVGKSSVFDEGFGNGRLRDLFLWLRAHSAVKQVSP